jgi:predicted kinase
MPSASPVFVVVSGPPGSGKTTLAAGLAAHLRLSLVSKDTIKESLMSVLPAEDIETSRQLGRAAIAALFAVAAESPTGAVLEANFSRALSAEEIEGLPGAVVEVFCKCEMAIGLARYRQRASSRHPGHFDADRTDEELWNDQVSQPVAGGWPVLEVVTDEPVDFLNVLPELQKVISSVRPLPAP